MGAREAVLSCQLHTKQPLGFRKEPTNEPITYTHTLRTDQNIASYSLFESFLRPENHYSICENVIVHQAHATDTNTLVHTPSSDCLFFPQEEIKRGVGWTRGNVPRVLLSACAVIKRAKPVIIVAYTPAGRRVRLRIAMQIQPAPCSCALHRHRCPTLQTPYQSPLSLGAAVRRLGVYISEPADMKVKGMCRK